MRLIVCGPSGALAVGLLFLANLNLHLCKKDRQEAVEKILVKETVAI